MVFSYSEDQKILVSNRAYSDVSISGNLNAFILLAAQLEDPDTLFFRRELLIEGDTELGLEVKNLLDSLDIESLSPELRFLLKSAGEFVHTLCYN
jgi:predicted lipid carrier protein YhbT